MLLLVSVRSAVEVESALAGGADIIDAKEPTRGSLGPVSAPTLTEIVRHVPPGQAFSAAAGDVSTTEEVRVALAENELPPRDGPTFLKLGFAGVQSPELVSNLLSTAVRLAARQRSSPLIIAVAYADSDRAGSLGTDDVCRLACEAGAGGILIDTCIKDGANLLSWMSLPALARCVEDARAAGLVTALAGALGPEHLTDVAAAQPDILGFRGAACDAGRAGRVSAERVARLRQGLRAASRNAGAWGEIPAHRHS